MNYEPRTRRGSALAVAAAVLFASSAFGEEVTATIQKANLWLYVTQASFSGMPMDTVDVTADSAFDINPMELTVGIVAKGKSSMRVPRAAVWCSPACSGTNARPRRYAG